MEKIQRWHEEPGVTYPILVVLGQTSALLKLRQNVGNGFIGIWKCQLRWSDQSWLIPAHTSHILLTVLQAKPGDYCSPHFTSCHSHLVLHLQPPQKFNLHFKRQIVSNIFIMLWVIDNMARLESVLQKILKIVIRVPRQDLLVTGEGRSGNCILQPQKVSSVCTRAVVKCSTSSPTYNIKLTQLDILEWPHFNSTLLDDLTTDPLGRTWHCCRPGWRWWGR